MAVRDRVMPKSRSRHSCVPGVVPLAPVVALARSRGEPCSHALTMALSSGFDSTPLSSVNQAATQCESVPPGQTDLLSAVAPEKFCMVG